jgi:hypothetical protein
LKTIDIVHLLRAFDRVFEDAALTNEEKLAVGAEVLHQLPHSHLVPSTQATLAAVQKSITARLATLETLEKPSGASAEAGRPKGPQKSGKSLRKAESDA